MFKRRERRPLVSRIRDVVWPRRGWHRGARYIGHRLGRLPGSPYRIACGFACGAAISFTPFIGFHFVLAMLLALMLRGNIIASAIGTAIGNPWTFPFIWAWIFGFGHWILGKGELNSETTGLTLAFIFEHPEQVLWPMTIGGIPTAIAVWGIAFVPAHSMVSQYQRARRWRIRRMAAARHRRRMEAKQAKEGLAMAPGQTAAERESTA